MNMSKTAGLWSCSVTVVVMVLVFLLCVAADSQHENLQMQSDKGDNSVRVRSWQRDLDMTASEMEQSTSFVEVAPPGAADEVGLARRDTRQRIEDLELVAQSPEIAWIRHQMGLIRSGWAWSTAHAQIASGFLRSQTSGRLFARRDEHAGLQLSTTFPRQWNEVVHTLSMPVSRFHSQFQALSLC